MTTVTQGGEPPAPATPPVPPPPAAAVPPAATPPAPPTDDQNPPWLAGRLARAESQLLERLGIKTEAEAKAAVEAQRAADEAKKTLEQKHAEAEGRAKKLQEEATELSTLVAQMATTRMATLTDAQRQAVTAVAGDNPKLQLSVLDAFQGTWAAASPPAPGTPPAPKPAHNAAPAPPPPAPGTPKTDFEKWNDLKATDPVGASLFYQMNSMKIEQSRRT